MRLAEDLSRFARGGRHAVRGLLNRPSFTLPVLLTLSLAIGATVVAFTVIDNVLVDPLPYRDPDALVDVAHEAPAAGLDELGASPAIYFTYREHNESFVALALWDSDDSPATVVGDGDPETVTTLAVTHEMLPILGIAPLQGRSFAASDDEVGSVPTVMLSHRYWQSRYGGEDVLGRTLNVQGVAREIIGVLPPTFRFFDYDADLLYPLQPSRDNAAFGSFDGRALARLRVGITLEQASADVRRMIPILQAEFPPLRAGFAGSGFAPKLRTLKDSVVRNLDDTLWILFGTTAALLLAACASVVNLVLLRHEARSGEVAIRMALGATRAGIGRLIAAEGIVLALVAGVLGLTIASFLLPLVLAETRELLPAVMVVRVDARVAAFTFGLAALAGLALAAAPAARLVRSSFVRALHLGAGVATAGKERHRTRHALVVAQVALAVLLLIGSGLMWRTFAALRDVPPGFVAPNTVQTFQLSLPTGTDAAAAVRAQQAITERLAAVNGVQSAALAAFDDPLPLDGDGRSAAIEVESRERPPGTEPPREVQLVSPGFFATLGTPLIVGRGFDWADVYERRPVAVVSESLAIEEWGSPAAALGKRVRVFTQAPWTEIVGVVGNVHHDGLDRPALGSVALPLQIDGFLGGSPMATFVVRSARVGSAGFIGELERAVWAQQPAVSLLNVKTLGDLYRRSLARTSLTLQLLGTMATIAMVLGIVGVYGSISYAVMQRRREIGICRALGAPDGALRFKFVKQALVLATSGVGLGAAAAAALSQALRSQLYGVGSLDPLTYAAVAVALVAAAAIASYVPARRAAAVDPMQVLRAD